MTARTLRGAAALVGAADIASPTGELDTHGRALEVAMIRQALDDAGLTLDDVDGVACAGQPAGLAEYLGIRPRYLDGTTVGGSSYELHVEHAAAAIAAGLCDVVVGVYASTPRSDRRRPERRGPGGRVGRRRDPTRVRVGDALRAAAAHRRHALAASRHMAVYGTTPEQLAQIAVDTRRWAAMNPNARHRDPITVDDVLDSPHGGVAAAPARLLPGDRRRRRLRHDLRRAGRDLARPPVVRARRRDRRHALDDHRDARPDRTGGRGVGARHSTWPASSPTTSTC